MNIKVIFHSYFRELTGCRETLEDVPDRTTLGTLVQQLQQKFPKLIAMQRSTLLAVGVEYQGLEYQLQAGDEVSLFPPVQGG